VQGARGTKLAVRLLVAGLSAAALLQAMRPAVYSARTGVHVVRDAGEPSSGRQLREQLEYICDELARQVPARTRVVVAEADAEWRARVTELATLRGIVVVTGGADLEVALEFDRAAPHGVRVVKRKPAVP
jgi:hypothetical protein